MKINVDKLAKALAIAIAAAMGADNDDDAGGDAAATTPAKGRGRPAGSTKAATAAKGKGKAAAKDEDDDGLGEDDDGLGDDDGDDGLGDLGEEEEVTQEDVVNAFKALKASKGIEKCREVLAKIDETNVLTIPAKKYPEALKEINRAASKK